MTSTQKNPRDAGHSESVEDVPRLVRGEDNVVSDYSLVTLAGLVSATLSFGSAAITTRLLAPSAFGVLSIVLVTSLIIQTATSSWTSLAVARFGRESVDTTGEMTAVSRSRLTLVAPWFVAAALLVFGIKAIGVLPREMTWPLTAVAVLHGSVAIGFEHCTNLLRSWGRQRLSAATVLVQQLLLTVVVAVLLAGHAHVRALDVALLYAAGSVLLLSLYTPVLWRVALRPVARDRELERRMMRFSAPLVAFTVSAYAIGSVDLWILSIYVRPEVVGSYAAVYRAYTTLMVIAAAATPVLTTLFVSLRLARRDAVVSDFTQRTVPTIVIAAGAVAAPLVAPAYALVPIVFGHAFAPASLPFAILAVGILVYFHCCLLGTVLVAHDRTADTARAIGAAAVLNIVGDFIAIGLLGAGPWAAALATTAAGFAWAFAYARSAARCTGTVPRYAWPAYLAPAVSVIVLAIAPVDARVIASMTAGLIAAVVAVEVARRRDLFDPRVIGLVTRRLRGHERVAS